jgi:hypothetical protein
MVDRCGQLRLLEEAVPERVVLGEARSQQLERNPPLEPQILGQVDDAHAAPAQQRLDPIAGELGADPRVVAHLHVRILASGGPAGNIRRLGCLCTAPALQRRFRRVTRVVRPRCGSAIGAWPSCASPTSPRSDGRGGRTRRSSASARARARRTRSSRCSARVRRRNVHRTGTISQHSSGDRWRSHEARRRPLFGPLRPVVAVTGATSLSCALPRGAVVWRFDRMMRGAERGAADGADERVR